MKKNSKLPDVQHQPFHIFRALHGSGTRGNAMTGGGLLQFPPPISSLQFFYLIQPYSFYHLAFPNHFPETPHLQLCLSVMTDSKCTVEYQPSYSSQGRIHNCFTLPLCGTTLENYLGILLLSFYLCKSKIKCLFHS